jgi:hypothetical protein
VDYRQPLSPRSHRGIITSVVPRGGIEPPT